MRGAGLKFKVSLLVRFNRGYDSLSELMQPRRRPRLLRSALVPRTILSLSSFSDTRLPVRLSFGLTLPLFDLSHLRPVYFKMQTNLLLLVFRKAFTLLLMQPLPHLSVFTSVVSEPASTARHYPAEAYVLLS